MTNIAVCGDINIAKNIGTWLANVNDAGSSTILIGENIGIIIAIEHNIAEITIPCVFDLLLKINPPLQ